MVFLRLTQLKTAISELLLSIANEVFMPKVGGVPGQNGIAPN
jgi:hypothetical protein